MSRLTWSSSVRAPEMAPGLVLVASLDPETGALALPGAFHCVSPRMRLVEVTVVRLERHPRPGEADWNATYRLWILHEGGSYRVDVSAQTHLTALDPHHPICTDCGEVWPCSDVRLDRAATELIAQLELTCAHCGQALGGANSESFYDGLTTRRYHTALSYRGPDGTRCLLALALAKASLPGAQP